MTAPKNRPGNLIEIRPSEANPAVSEAATLLRTDDLEIIRLTVPAGQNVPTHELQGEVVVHCLAGRVSLRTREMTQELRANQLLHYRANEPISVQATENTLLLVTIVRRRLGEHTELIG